MLVHGGSKAGELEKARAAWRHVPAHLTLVLLALTFSTASAFAADPAWEQCMQEDDHRRAIDGCTEILDRGAVESAERRKLAFTRRGLALSRTSGWRLDAVLPDLDEAIRLDPNDPEAFLNRGRIFLVKGVSSPIAKRGNDRAIA